MTIFMKLRLVAFVIIPWGVCSTALLGQQEPPRLALDAGGHTALVRRGLFVRGGKEVVTVSDDKTIRFWDAASGQPLRTLRTPRGVGIDGMLFAADVSSDGNTLAVAGCGSFHLGDMPIYLIDIAEGRIDKVLRGHTGVVNSLAFAARGHALASVSHDKTVRVWDTNTGETVHVLKGHTDSTYGVAFSPDASRLASASLDHTARVWNLKTGQTEQILRGHSAKLQAVAWSHDGQRLATGGWDQAIRLWDGDGRLVHTFDRMRGLVTSLRFVSQDRELLFSTGAFEVRDGVGRAGLLDLYKSGRVRAEKIERDSLVTSADLSPDGRRVLSTGQNHESYVWRSADGQAISRLAGRGKEMVAVGWSANGSEIAFGTVHFDSRKGTDPLERSFSLELLEWTQTPPATFMGRRLTLGNISLVFSSINTIHSRRPGSDVAFEAFSLPHEKVRCGTLVSDRLAAIGTDYGCHLFDVGTGKYLRSLQGVAGTVMSVAASPTGRLLLTGSLDQTVRLWALDNPNPLLSLFFAGEEWIAWTPEGYYAASPGGERLMGWLVSNGKDQLESFYPAAQFRKSMNRPDIIKLLLRTLSVEQARVFADNARGIKTEHLNIAHVLPPKVKITAPQRLLTINDSALEVTARATSAGTHPVTAMQLLVDSRPFDGQNGVFRVQSPKLGDVESTWSIKLTPGKHRLSVRAENAVSSALSDDVEIHYVTSSPAEELRLPSLYLVSVGISDYPGDLKLNYAAKDAEAIVKTFQDHSQTLFEKIEIKQLTNGQATRREILKGLSWLGRQMTQRDVGLLFLAGHGQMSGTGTFFYLPADVDANDIDGTGVAGDQIKSQLASMPGRILFLLDACHAGGFEGFKKRGIRSLTDDLIRDLVADERGIIALCAATGRQFALESNEHRQGLFTLALMEGLQGKAQKLEGAVYLHHLDAYVIDRVKELSQGRQSPTSVRPAGVRSFPLSRPWPK
jgi:WD40 repeat protein